MATRANGTVGSPFTDACLTTTIDMQLHDWSNEGHGGGIVHQSWPVHSMLTTVLVLPLYWIQVADILAFGPMDRFTDNCRLCIQDL